MLQVLWAGGAAKHWRLYIHHGTLHAAVPRSIVAAFPDVSRCKLWVAVRGCVRPWQRACAAHKLSIAIVCIADANQHR